MRILQISDEVLQRLWEWIREDQNLYELLAMNYEEFVLRVTQRDVILLYLEGGDSLFYLTGVAPRKTAMVHIVSREKNIDPVAYRKLLRELLDWAFRTFHLKRLTGMIGVENTLARNLSKKLGFTEEGVLKSWVVDQKGRTHDIVISRLLWEEFQNGI